MSYNSQIQSTIQRYIEVTGITPEGNLQAQYFTALAYFKEQNHHFTLEEIEDPQEGITYYIRLKDCRIQYTFKDNWIIGQEIEDTIYD